MIFCDTTNINANADGKIEFIKIEDKMKIY